ESTAPKPQRDCSPPSPADIGDYPENGMRKILAQLGENPIRESRSAALNRGAARQRKVTGWGLCRTRLQFKIKLTLRIDHKHAFCVVCSVVRRGADVDFSREHASERRENDHARRRVATQRQDRGSAR